MSPSPSPQSPGQLLKLPSISANVRIWAIGVLLVDSARAYGACLPSSYVGPFGMLGVSFVHFLADGVAPAMDFQDAGQAAAGGSTAQGDYARPT